MKSYNEMAESVLERRDEYRDKKRRAINKLKKGMAAALCCCLLGVLCVGLIRGDKTGASLPDTPLPPVQAEQVTVQPGLSSEQSTEAQSPVWLSAEEILKTDDVYMGVFVPAFLSWQGGFYGGTEITEDDRFAVTEGKVWFNPEYRYAVYQVKDRSDCIAICINGGLQVYQKLFGVCFELDGMTYGIHYSPDIGTEYTAGKEILSGDGFTVHEAIRLNGEANGTEYLVNILPLLKAQLPNFFSDDENYSEAWQIAMPLNEMQK